MGSRTGVGKSERTEAASPRGRASVSRVPPFSRAADYSPGLVFHAKRFIYSGISLKVSRCSPTLSQTKWRTKRRRRTRPEVPLSFCYGNRRMRTARFERVRVRDLRAAFAHIRQFQFDLYQALLSESTC